MGFFDKKDAPEQAEEDREQVITRNARQAATFTRVAESQDGQLCLFMDTEGHLTAVRSSRLV
ncbi:MAG: hypothetical protein Q4E12_05200 [Coriobacteriia bacterium]|nr:hypothetical protein [Coriobacteriia bacterium]